ncbi:hypothetical protein DSECCO2_562400 [anaerobic digester metagenome]
MQGHGRGHAPAVDGLVQLQGRAQGGQAVVDVRGHAPGVLQGGRDEAAHGFLGLGVQAREGALPADAPEQELARGQFLDAGGVGHRVLARQAQGDVDALDLVADLRLDGRQDQGVLGGRAAVEPPLFQQGGRGPGVGAARFHVLQLRAQVLLLAGQGPHGLAQAGQHVAVARRRQEQNRAPRRFGGEAVGHVQQGGQGHGLVGGRGMARHVAAAVEEGLDHEQLSGRFRILPRDEAPDVGAAPLGPARAGLQARGAARDGSRMAEPGLELVGPDPEPREVHGRELLLVAEAQTRRGLAPAVEIDQGAGPEIGGVQPAAPRVEVHEHDAAGHVLAVEILEAPLADENEAALVPGLQALGGQGVGEEGAQGEACAADGQGGAVEDAHGGDEVLAADGGVQMVGQLLENLPHVVGRARLARRAQGTVRHRGDGPQVLLHPGQGGRPGQREAQEQEGDAGVTRAHVAPGWSRWRCSALRGSRSCRCGRRGSRPRGRRR